MQTEIVDAGDSNRSGQQQEYTALDLLYLRAMESMLAGQTREEMAEAVGYSHRHIRRWRQTERWRELWNEVAGDQLIHIRSQLIGLGGISIRTLRALVEDGSEKGAPTRAYVAFGILDRIKHIAPIEQDGQIRRIISRVPRSEQLPVMPMDMESGEASQLPVQSPTPLDAPEYYGIPASDIPQTRLSVRERRHSTYRTPPPPHGDA
jgi:hypothetical protein